MGAFCFCPCPFLCIYSLSSAKGKPCEHKEKNIPYLSFNETFKRKAAAKICNIYFIYLSQIVFMG